MVMKKNFTIIMPTVIDCAIMKCGGLKIVPEQNQPNLTKPNQI